MRTAPIAATLAIAGALAGCGSATPSRPGGSSQSRSGAPSHPASGAKVFSEQCSVCHSVIGNESLHRQGGDLLGYRLTHQQLVLQVRQMPVKRPLSQAELDAVVQYVWSLQHSPARPQINLPAPAPRR
jgi:mono/diheme cytochrome c family protein